MGIYDQTILCGNFLLQCISGLPRNPLGSFGLLYSPFFYSHNVAYL